MKKILLLFIKLLLRLFQIIKSLPDRIIFYLNIIKTYLTGNECKRFKDCILLQKLKSSQPPCADRHLEYPWIIENINIKEGKLLDVGSTACELLYELLPKTIEIHGINLNDQVIQNKQIRFSKGDIRKTDYPDNYFDCITCISTLEHIGVAGRYNSDNDPEGDIKTMQEMNRILKTDGILLVTVPYGIKDVLPINKLYNKNRIEKLFRGYNIVEQKFLKFNKQFSLWLKVTEEEAAKTDMFKDRWYAIALMKATKR